MTFPDYPNGTLPLLEVKGEYLTQSLAIARYVARICGEYSNISYRIFASRKKYIPFKHKIVLYRFVYSLSVASI